jgi:hypothetical protein
MSRIYSGEWKRVIRCMREQSCRAATRRRKQRAALRCAAGAGSLITKPPPLDTAGQYERDYLPHRLNNWMAPDSEKQRVRLGWDCRRRVPQQLPGSPATHHAAAIRPRTSIPLVHTNPGHQRQQVWDVEVAGARRPHRVCGGPAGAPAARCVRAHACVNLLDSALHAPRLLTTTTGRRTPRRPQKEQRLFPRRGAGRRRPPALAEPHPRAAGCAGGRDGIQGHHNGLPALLDGDHQDGGGGRLQGEQIPVEVGKVLSAA